VKHWWISDLTDYEICYYNLIKRFLINPRILIIHDNKYLVQLSVLSDEADLLMIVIDLSYSPSQRIN